MYNNTNHTSCPTPPLRGGRVGLLLLSIIISTTLSAQPFAMKKKVADRYNDRFEFYKAIPMYEQLHASLPFNREIIEKLAQAFYRINDPEHAEHWFSLLVDTPAIVAQHALDYAEVLAQNGKYAQSREWYIKYKDLNPADVRGESFAKAYENISQFYKDSLSYASRRLSCNSEFSDFSPMFYHSGLVFPSAREKKGAIRLWYSWTNSSYLDLFFVANPDSSATTEFLPGLSSLYHEGPCTFNKTLDTIYFTRSNFYKFRFRKSDDKINKLKIYTAVWDTTKKEWINASPLPFNNNNYSCGHPTLSTDGSKMYFVSDMPGGMGGTDIYISQKIIDASGKVTWDTPENLGETINTAGNEMFPYLDIDGNLFFASNGIPGLGGLDVFMAKKKNDSFEKPVNMGYPVNTRYDDFGLIAAANGKSGYFSSDRYNAVGNDDIYRWKRISRNLAILVFDKKTNAPLSSANIKISTIAVDPESKVSNNQGFSTLVAQPGKPYQFDVSKEKYVDNKIELTAAELAELDTVRLPLEKYVPKFKLTGKIYSEDDKQPISNATATLINLTDSSKITALSDNSGAFNFELQAESDYKVSISMTAQGKKCGTNPVERSTRGLENDNTFFEVFPVFCVGDVIKIDNIYYDLGKWDIRPDAAKELDKVLDLMAKYPKMKIELRSHTDSRGSDAANMTLSDKRAKSAVAYLVSKGVPQANIVGKGYGESMPFNRCVNGVKCSDEEYQANRRTEFKILSIE